MIIKNSPSRPVSTNQTNVVYEFKCPVGVCDSSVDNKYIGHTRTTLSRRLTLHLNDSSAIYQHLKTHKELPGPLRENLVNNTKIIHTSACSKRLEIIEALYIKIKNPTLNKINFSYGFNILKLFNNWRQPSPLYIKLKHPSPLYIKIKHPPTLCI